MLTFVAIVAVTVVLIINSFCDGTSPAEEEGKDIEIVEIEGRSFFAALMIVKDPSRVSLATTYPWKEYGVPLDVLVEQSGAVAGINGGSYNSYNHAGGSPLSVLVIDISDMKKADVEKLVAEQKIRDAV